MKQNIFCFSKELENEILGEGESVDAEMDAYSGSDNGAGIFMQEEDISLLKDISEEERKILNKLANGGTTMVENFNNHTRSRYAPWLV